MSKLMCKQVQLPEHDPNDLENHLLQVATCSVLHDTAESIHALALIQ